jgi:glycosyltransferase involved in cell wall biosynthesis
MPIYNGGIYLQNAVKSILLQTFNDFELIIIDDASTDNSITSIYDIIDKRVVILKNSKNMGLAECLNIGIDRAKGKYIARMDQDDISYPERLKLQFEMLEINPNLDLVGVRCLMIDECNDPVGYLPFALDHKKLCAAPWRGIYLPHPTWMGRTTWFLRNKYAYPAPFLCEDQELLLRTCHNSEFRTYPAILFAYRVRSKINFYKNLKNRYSVFMMQSLYFLNKGKFNWCIYSGIFFSLRILSDLRRIISRIFSKTKSFYIHNNVDKEDREKFEKIFSKINIS